MFNKWKRKRAVKQYISRLPKLLKEDYGSRRGCTEGQIAASIQRHKLNEKYIYLACFLFMDKQGFEASSYAGSHDYQSVKYEYETHLTPLFGGIFGSGDYSDGGGFDGGSE